MRSATPERWTGRTAAISAVARRWWACCRCGCGEPPGGSAAEVVRGDEIALERGTETRRQVGHLLAFEDGDGGEDLVAGGVELQLVALDFVLRRLQLTECPARTAAKVQP